MFVITNGRVWLKQEKTGQWISTNQFSQATKILKKDKAESVMANLPKTMRRLDFFIQEIEEDFSESETKTLTFDKNISLSEIAPDFEDIKDIVSQFDKLYETMSAAESFLRFKLKGIEEKQQDLLHAVEFNSYNACEGFKKYKEIKLVREERRRIKDSLLIIQILKESLKEGYRPNELTNRIEGLENRKYSVRFDENLF